MKIILTVVTKCQILTQKCTKFDFGWGTAPGPAGGGELKALPWPPSWWEGDWPPLPTELTMLWRGEIRS